MKQEQAAASATKQPAVKPRSSPGPKGQYPPPAALLEVADREPERRRIDEYAEVIGKLRKKGFAYRSIADWLCKRGVPTDHNEVYRAHKDYCEAAPKGYFEGKQRAKEDGPS